MMLGFSAFDPLGSGHFWLSWLGYSIRGHDDDIIVVTVLLHDPNLHFKADLSKGEKRLDICSCNLTRCS